MPVHAYNAAERALHHLALGSRSIAEITFDLNALLWARDDENETDQRPVFVAGLARAGTTIVMRRLYETGLFRSLTYRDMPFVLCPNLWQRLSNLSRRDIASVERAHGDRIAIDADSPEALDEVFWRVFAGSDYIKPDHLCAHEADEELLAKFRRYISCILHSRGRKQRYLSKNNNNILRLRTLQMAFPRSAIVIPFRDPVQHANSLRNQHTQFCRLQGETPFTRSYMTWLAHHEFGLEHRPFWFDGGRPFTTSAYHASDINYWLETWLRTYGWLHDNRPSNSILVCYEDLCSSPAAWERTVARLDVESGPNVAERPFSRGADKDVTGLAESLLQPAYRLYSELREASDAAPADSERLSG